MYCNSTWHLILRKAMSIFDESLTQHGVYH
jgi:hypothetical protein